MGRQWASVFQVDSLRVIVAISRCCHPVRRRHSVKNQIAIHIKGNISRYTHSCVCSTPATAWAPEPSADRRIRASVPVPYRHHRVPVPSTVIVPVSLPDITVVVAVLVEGTFEQLSLLGEHHQLWSCPGYVRHESSRTYLETPTMTRQSDGKCSLAETHLAARNKSRQKSSAVGWV